MEEIKKKKVGCLGLSADPPHGGHLEIAELLLKKKLADEVWLVPCYEHSFGKPLSEPEHRWQMAKFLESGRIKVSDAEFSRKGKSYTIDTVRALKEKYPDYYFFWVIGSDVVKTGSFLRWKDWSELSFLVDFFVISRAGFEIRTCELRSQNLDSPRNLSYNLEFKNPPTGFRLIKGKISDISSSTIREKTRHGFSIDKLVPPKIKKYIEKHKLYK